MIFHGVDRPPIVTTSSPEDHLQSNGSPPGPSPNSQVLPSGSPPQLEPAPASDSLALANNPVPSSTAPYSQPVLRNGAGENIELKDVIVVHDLDSEPKRY